MTDYRIRTYSEVEGDDRSDLPGQMARQRRRVERRLASVDRVLAVVSGKGGVGKSFVAAGVAAALRASGRATGLLDADLDGPSGARILGVEAGGLRVSGEGVVPAESPAGVPLISTALLLEEEAPLRWKRAEGDSFVWRGAQERGVLREFLSDVVWGDLDLLVVDLPPGPRRFEQLAGLLSGGWGCLAVTLPTATSGASVERTLELARGRGVPVVGVVENMARYACPGCGEEGPLFPGRAGRRLADAFEAPLLARIPFDPEAAALADRGEARALLDRTRAGAELRELAEGAIRALRSPDGGSRKDAPGAGEATGP